MKMLIALASGFLLWLIYGLMRGDLIIVAANAMSLVLAALLLSFKMRENAVSHAT